MKEMNITVNGDQKEITILEGKALELKHPVQMKIGGRIDSISSFLKSRYPLRIGKGLQYVDPDKAVVIVDEDEMYIKLLLDAENPFGWEITSRLEFATELLQLCIKMSATGEPRQWTRKEQVNLIRYNKRFFKPDAYEAVLNAYQKLNYTVTSQVKNESDNRGNRDQEFKKKIASEHIPEFFVLTMPVFKGQPERTFKVEVCFEATDASFVAWFESPELVDIIEHDKKDLFAKELDPCEQFAIISK